MRGVEESSPGSGAAPPGVAAAPAAPRREPCPEASLGREPAQLVSGLCLAPPSGDPTPAAAQSSSALLLALRSSEPEAPSAWTPAHPASSACVSSTPAPPAPLVPPAPLPAAASPTPPTSSAASAAPASSRVDPRLGAFPEPPLPASVAAACEAPAGQPPRPHRVHSSADALASSAGSKYDSVKIRVWLSEGRSYVLSRFVVAQALARTRIPHADAVRTSLAVKKALVDAGRLNVSQEDLDAEVVRGMALQGFGEEHARRYTLCSRLFRSGRPLLVLVAGPGCAGSSALSRGLASRLNLTHVVQIEMLLELLGDDLKWASDEGDEAQDGGGQAREGRASAGVPSADDVASPRERRAPALAPWAHRPRGDACPSATALSTSGRATDEAGTPAGCEVSPLSRALRPSICMSCRLARRALSGELSKCLRDGRPLVVEGAHVDLWAWAAEAAAQGWVWATGSEGGEPAGVAATRVSPLPARSRRRPPLVVLPVALVDPPPGPRLDRLRRVVAPSDSLEPSLSSLRAVDDFILQGALAEGVPRFSLEQRGHEATLDAVHAHVFDELLRIAAGMEPREEKRGSA